jgi:fructokinase
MGTGLIALDVVINGIDEEKASLWAGGSCGNVLTLLAYLGWSSYPIANHKEDCASEIIQKDMTRWGVNMRFIFRSENGITPIVVERLRCNGTSSSHEFQFKCPICGAQLPRNRPIPLEIVARTKQNMPSAQVFYFDRVSRAALVLAEEQRAQGSLIVFEPVTLSKERLFNESLEIAHIVKYSGEQVDISNFKCNIPLEIQTLGFRGLKYRFKSFEHSSSNWSELPAFPVSELVDSAGAGDWCTAGIIHYLGQKGAAEFTNASDQEIENALLFGEALAALKCRYKGARGTMYYATKNELESFICGLLEGKNLDLHLSRSSQERESRSMKHICPGCR